MASCSRAGFVRAFKIDYTIWHDTARNHLVRKVEMRFSATERYEAEVTEFSEPAPGLYCPTRAVARMWIGDNHKESVTSLSNVAVNVPVPHATMALPNVPSDTLMEDEVRGVKYLIDGRGGKIGPEQPLVKMSVAISKSSSGDDDTEQSVGEARPSGWWIVPAAGLLLAATGVLAFRRWRRQDRNDD